MVLNEDDSELSVRTNIVSSPNTHYSMLGPNDSGFVKVFQKRISIPSLTGNTEYRCSVVKKLARPLYVRMKQGFHVNLC